MNSQNNVENDDIVIEDVQIVNSTNNNLINGNVRYTGKDST
jgi:hypothetical protein